MVWPEDLRERGEALDRLSTEDQAHIMRTLGALIREAKTRKAFG